MRRFYNNGTGFLETITKGLSNLTPGGAAANVVKKVIKSKEDKKSINPDPKTPKMMGTDKETKDKTEITKRLGRDDEIKRKQFEKKFPKFKYERQMSKFKKKKEVPPKQLKKRKS